MSLWEQTSNINKKKTLLENNSCKLAEFGFPQLAPEEGNYL